MLAVIFEVQPTEDGRGQYLEIAAQLKPVLSQIEGFISVERFQSMADPNRVLSLSFFQDEAAVKQWREVMCHRQAQSKGRSELFAGYRIRVAEVLRDYGMDEREQVPKDNNSHPDLSA